MININASLLVVFLIVWILVFALSKLFFNPLRKIMKERSDKIQGNRKGFQKSSEAFEQTASEIEKRIKSAEAPDKR
jgi:F0F1-type ATP synthase membrane subunit b/b'